MKRSFVMLSCLFVIGCTPSAPPSIYHRTGSTYAERAYDHDQCTFTSVRAVPRAMATSVSGGYYNPGTVFCNTYGTVTACNRVGSYNVPPTATTYDANQGIRNRYMERCMQQKGYSVLYRPRCVTSAEKAAAIASRNAPQLPANQIICIMGQT